MSRRCPACGTEFPDEVAFCGYDGNVTIHVLPPGEADARLGEQLGKYIVAAHIADGAMGAVYEARNAETRERVAIKVLHLDVEEDDIAVERFKREYETADMFSHPHIVKVIDFGETSDGQHYMTMEYLEGLELGELVRRHGQQSAARALRILAQVALALEHAHEFGVIHRDLKPDNIFLCRGAGGDDVRILDFGSVKLQVETGPKLTAFGTTLGSPYYMSPEQAKGLPDVDGRTDVFAMGAILYEMLGGKIAFEAPTVAEILMKIVRQMPTPIHQLREGLPPGIHGVIERALAKKKEDRYETPVALADAALEVFGLAGGASVWAERTEDELAAALATATPAGAAAPAAPAVSE
ncbi:MAG: serine/threonine protein kinase, partial [Sandaracinaceae bacterium]|nr:serine/threonine protein kinase [Sandaracinaceae bacterium]